MTKGEESRCCSGGSHDEHHHHHHNGHVNAHVHEHHDGHSHSHSHSHDRGHGHGHEDKHLKKKTGSCCGGNSNSNASANGNGNGNNDGACSHNSHSDNHHEKHDHDHDHDHGHGHSCSHDHSHDHHHGVSVKKEGSNNGSNTCKDRIDHGTPDCVAILREDGQVDVYDVGGQVKTFSGTATGTASDTASGNASSTSKVCFSSHGNEEMDKFLTHCFDREGRHGTPDEACFCGDDGPHLHAHLRNDTNCNSPSSSSSSSGIEKLANVTLHPVEGGISSSNSTCSKHSHPHSSRSSSPTATSCPLPASDNLPSKCNSTEFTKSLAEFGNGFAEEYDACKERILEIPHDDHMDVLVHNTKTGKVTLEHDCKDCGDTDVHGALELVSKRSFHTGRLSGSGSCSGSGCSASHHNDRNIQMNFYEVAKTPLQLLDVLADFFAMEEDKSYIIRNAFHSSSSATTPSPSKNGKKSCCKSGACTHLNDIDRVHVHTPKTRTTACGGNVVRNGGGGGTRSATHEHGTVRSTIHVTQICCAAEIPMIHSILRPLRGVSDVSISTMTKLVHIVHDPEVTGAEEVVQALNREKFGATLKKNGASQKSFTAPVPQPAGSTSTCGRSSFYVSGICCSAEIPAINSILEPKKGVQKVTINVPNKTVYVEHEFALISAKDIKDALDKEKFDCRIDRDAGAEAERIRPTTLRSATIMSKYVESTFRIDSFMGQQQDDGNRIKTLLREEFSKDHVSYADVHIPSKTVKVDHNPQLVSVHTLLDFMKKNGFELSLVADGLKEGIWTSGEDEDHLEEEHTKLQWHIILSGLFWIVSMLHFIGGKWDYLKYTGIISVLLGIPKIATKAFMTMRRRQFDTNCMMLFATLGALALQEFSEAAAVTFLFSISDWLEALSTARARNALSAIVRLRPERAKVKDPISGKFVFAPASSVVVGSIVSVRTGDKIPCDGIVVEGSSVVDESSLTGESRPVQKGPGSIVSGGTVNAGVAQLLVETTSTSENSAVARLIRLVEDAQANRSPTEKMIDAFAKRYTPLVVLLAISMCTFPWIAGIEAGHRWTKIGLVTIVIACPCALIISTPVTYVAGLAAAAQRGIVVKGGAHLETLGRVKKIAFDKTGTLTEGNFKLLHLRTWGTKSREEVLQYLYCIEADASHPLAAAIISAAKAENVSVPLSWTIENHQNLDGEGVTACINGEAVHVGNFRLFERLTYINDLSGGDVQIAKKWMDDGGTVGFLSIEGHGIVASYCVADAVREEAAGVIASFNKLGIDINMLTGDNSKAAIAIGQGLGLTERQIKSQLLPSQKLDLVKELIKEENSSSVGGRPCLQRKRPGLVLMCGDGVNDAPALAIADVGVAMGAGAALAMETADVTLLDSNLLKLLKVVKLGRRVNRTIIENVVFSFVAKAVVMGFTFAGYGSLWAAIGSDVGAMLIVTANGMKLLPSKKSVRRTTGFDSFEVRGSSRPGAKNTNVSFPISVEAGEEKLSL